MSFGAIPTTSYTSIGRKSSVADLYRYLRCGVALRRSHVGFFEGRVFVFPEAGSNQCRFAGLAGAGQCHHRILLL